MNFPLITLKKHEEHRILSGHLWIYSNEIDNEKTPLTQFKPGEQVIIQAANGKTLGCGYVNPHSLISVRLVSRDAEKSLTKELIKKRLEQALALRDQLYANSCYRLVYGESDNLPGLVVDRYGDILVCQVNTAGMEAVLDDIREALKGLLNPRGILLRNDGSFRQIEGLEAKVETLYGEVPEQAELIENGFHFLAPIIKGQKTGWFYDHGANRARLKSYAKDKRVLDVFSYVGAWGIAAANYGANQVTCIDSSAQALNWLMENAKLNQCENKITTLQNDAFTALNQLKENNEKFDVVILDPPAFIKRRKDLKEGLHAYRRLNQLAAKLLTPHGILFSASCSLHLTHENLVDIIRTSGFKQDQYLQIIEQGHQAPDHPIHPAIPETEYLKLFVARQV